MDSGLVESLGRRERWRDRIGIALMIVVIVVPPFLLVKFFAGRSYEPGGKFLAALRADPVLDLDPPPGSIELELDHLEKPTSRSGRGGACEGAYINKHYTGGGLRSLDELRDYYHRKVLVLGWVYEDDSYDSSYTGRYRKTVASRTRRLGLGNGSVAGAAFSFNFILFTVAEEGDCRKIPG